MHRRINVMGKKNESIQEGGGVGEEEKRSKGGWREEGKGIHTAVHGLYCLLHYL